MKAVTRIATGYVLCSHHDNTNYTVHACKPQTPSLTWVWNHTTQCMWHIRQPQPWSLTHTWTQNLRHWRIYLLQSVGRSMTDFCPISITYMDENDRHSKWNLSESLSLSTINPDSIKQHTLKCGQHAWADILKSTEPLAVTLGYESYTQFTTYK